MKPHFRLLIAHVVIQRKRNVLQCKYVRYSGMQNDTFYVSMRKCSGGTFGANGVDAMLFGLAAADQLAVDLGAINQTADL
jgi:hypothetical protein